MLSMVTPSFGLSGQEGPEGISLLPPEEAREEREGRVPQSLTGICV